MEFQGEDVSLLWKLSRQARVDAFEAAYAQYGSRMFAFPSFFKVKDWAKLCTTLINAPILNNRPKGIRTIAIFSHHYVFGGTERCISYLMPLFQSLGYKVVLITDADTSNDAYLTPPGATRLLFGEENGIAQPLKNLQYRCERWHQFIKENHIDAVYYVHHTGNVRLLDFLSIRAAGAYILYHFHFCFTQNLIVNDVPFFKNFSDILKLTDTIVGLSRVDERFFRLCQTRAYYFPNKCFFEQLPPLHAKSVSSRMNCLWCARINVQKQPLEIIPIFAKIRAAIPEATLTILGDAKVSSGVEMKLKGQMIAQMKKSGCEDAVVWAGFQTDVLPYYKQADLLISTAKWEGFPLTHIEAYAHGLPVVAYEMPYLETLKDRKAARCVPQGDQQAAAEAAIELLTNPEVYREASQAARKVAETFMDFDQASAWKKVIEELPQPYTPQETEADQIDRVMLETILLHGTWARLPQQTQNQLVQTRKQLAAAQTDLRKLRATRAWRIGRAVTFLPRKAKGGIKCLRENGLCYTLRRAVKKVLRY